MSDTESKQSLREVVWAALEESGDERFPGAEGRIPNFTGRDEAASRLFDHPAYEGAERIKVNPDSPQTPVRRRALEDGKVLYMAVPRLRDRRCFLELDPDDMEGSPSDWKSIRGASEHGQPVHPNEMEPVDLIVTGVVATDADGHRLGKGGGYSDLEFAVLREYDLVEPDVSILSTLHPVQELEPGRIPRDDEDISLSGYFRPDRSVTVEDPPARPSGIDPEELTDEQRDSIPILEDVLDGKPAS